MVGGGWSGIAAAWYLHQAGYQVTVYDRGQSLGGRSGSARLGERTVTLGGKNIGTRYALFREFVSAVGGGEFEYFGINTSRVENGRLRTVDGGAKWRAALGLLRRTPPGDALRLIRLVRLMNSDEANRYLDGPGFTSLARRRGDPPLDRVFGSHLLDNMVRPMTVRMNAAEPDEIFLSTFGTNLGMLFDHFDQLTAGFEPVFRNLTARVETQLGTTVRRIMHDGSAAVGLEVTTEDGTVAHHAADLVVVALPSRDAAVLAKPLNAMLADTLQEIRYFPAAVAIVEYSRPIFTEQTRALVFGADSPLSNAGAYGVHDRHIVRYTFSGREARPALVDKPDPTDLARLGEAALNQYITVSPQARRHVTGIVWEQGLCAYGPQHDDRLSRIERETRRLSNVVLTGDYLRGASIEACFRAARASTAAWMPRTPAYRQKPDRPAGVSSW